MKRELQILKSWTLLEQCFRLALLKRGFLQIYSPIFTQVELEPYGGGAFKLDYYGKQAYLSQSPMLYKQLGIQKGIESLFVISENIRQPQSKDDYLSTEFTSWDFEIAGISSLARLLKLTETVIFESLIESKIKTGILILKMEKAQNILKEQGHALNNDAGLNQVEQRTLAEIVQKTSGQQLVIVTHFPATSRAFYYRQTHPGTKRQALCFDIIFRGVEIGSGGIHENRYDQLVRQAKVKYTHIGKLKSYVDMFKDGMPPHGGVSLSPARIVQAVLGLPSTKEATLFPRTPKTVFP